MISITSMLFDSRRWKVTDTVLKQYIKVLYALGSSAAISVGATGFVTFTGIGIESYTGLAKTDYNDFIDEQVNKRVKGYFYNVSY